MKKFLYSHPNIIIGTLATVLIVVLAVFYFRGIADVFDQMGRALASPPAQSAVGFDLSKASKLDLRGLMDDASLAPVIAPVSVATSTASASTTSSSTP